MKLKFYFLIPAFVLVFAAPSAHSADTPAADPDPSQIQTDPTSPEPENGEISAQIVLDQSPEFIQAIEDLGLQQMRQGNHAEAKKLFEQILEHQPDNDKWRSLANTATFWALLKESSTAREKKLLAEAEKKIREALLIEPNNAEGLAVLGGIQLDQKNLSEAEKSFRAALKHEPDNSSAMYGLTGLLAQQGRRKEALALLDSLGDAQSVAGKKFVSIRAALLRDEADALTAEGKTDQAIATLKHALSLDPHNAWLRFDLARLYQKQNAAPQAEALMAEGLQVASDKVQMRYAYALFLHGIDRDDEALQMLEKISVVERSPSMHDLQQKIKHALQDSKKKTLFLNDNENVGLSRPGADGYVATGLDYRNKPGTNGISSLKASEATVMSRIPVKWGGYALIQLDRVNVRAGTLPFSDLATLTQYGTIQALDPLGTSSANAPAQEDDGVALAVGYENDSLRVDIGTTPLGFAVQRMVGGIKLHRYFALISGNSISGSLDLSKRPVTSSLVSYAGAHDPASGEVWGGVTRSGANVRVDYDRGRFSAYSNLGYHLLTGKNVLDNSQFELRPGVDWTFISTENMRVYAGLVYTYWRYKENLRHYSFGHGGYYSPQSYQSLAIPVRWTGRSGRWAYLLKGAVVASVSKEKTMPYYPTDSGLQTQGGNSIYTGSSSNGTGYSLGTALEYQSTPHVFLGARFEIDRSEYYTPNFMAVYARFKFDAQHQPISFPPDAVEPYSQF